MPHLAYIGLGTNLCCGQCTDRQQQLHNNLNKAIHALQEQIGTLLKCSSFVRTKPWGFASENTFLNAAASFRTELTPQQLLSTTQDIEIKMGRTAKSHDSQYQDRIIDIDILFYDDMTLSTPDLTIPHPQINIRSFVLQPLAEIAPYYLHPTLHKTIAQLLEELQGKTDNQNNH